MIAVETVILITVVAVLLVVFLAVGRKSDSVSKLPPGPFPWPFVGNVKQLRKLSQKLGGQHVALLELSRQYASPVFKLRLGRNDTFVVSGKQGIHTVLNSEEYEGRPWNYFIRLRNMGKKKGITMNDGPEWRCIRSWFVRSMRSVGFARREMSEYITEELECILENIQDGGVRQMKQIIVPAIINVLWIFAAGKKFDQNKLQYFIDLMGRRAQAFDMTGGILSAFPWIRHIAPNYSGYNLLVTLNNEFKSILTEIIDEHKKNFIAGTERDVIDMFLTEMYSGKGPETVFDDDQLVMILVDILLAGLNITATTLDFLFLTMLINQDSQRLLHDEIDRVIGQDRLPNMNDKANMPYLEAVILESQRLAPVVPVIGPRRVLRDTELLGYHIPRESFVIINLHSIHADSELYPEPKLFKPERFLVEPHSSSRFRDDNLLFFGKGKRQCPGVALAKTALFLLFAGIMQRYEILPVPDQDPPSLRINPGLTLSPKPYNVLLRMRKVNEPD
ncbi:hypothetical protein QAD02_009141 [Eretmocerus hayati]|uniref:Uncharacterized protein n=1 Tax=Eretmocerus hayati TaxID=131215 RepID=A0ACC2N8P5_9HYME|nr:hypothetical protein QAD02_009141 [Eretmocerus hayati]